MARLLRVAVFQIVILAMSFASTGCISLHSINPKDYPPMGDKHLDPQAFAKPDPLEGQWHSLRVSPDPNVIVCRWQKLNPVWWFGNQDEPTPPPWYRPKGHFRTVLWHFRNPMHNFNHYVVGIQDKESVRSGRYPRTLSKPEGGWTFAVTKYKHLRLPFVDYRRGKLQFYFGWRIGGNFGIKCNLHDENAAKPDPQEAAHQISD